jgi:hypothetical protein
LQRGGIVMLAVAFRPTVEDGIGACTSTSTSTSTNTALEGWESLFVPPHVHAAVQ